MLRIYKVKMNKIFQVIIVLLIWLFNGCSLKQETVSSMNSESDLMLNTTNNQIVNNNQSTNEKTSDVEKEIWNIRSRNKLLSWTTKDFYIISNNKKQPVFSPSFKEFHEQGVKNVRDFLQKNNAKYGGQSQIKVSSEAYVIVKSIVGSIITFEVSYRSIAEGGTDSVDTWWLTLDLAKSGIIEPFSAIDGENPDCNRIIELSEIFPENQILSALLDNPEVKHTINLQNRKNPIKSLKDLFSNGGKYTGVKYEDTPRLEIGSDGYFLTDYSLEHFVFDRIENDKVIVQLALTRTETRSYEVQFLEVELPIPTNLKNALRLAESREIGFLGKDSQKIANGNKTTIEFVSNVSEEVSKR